MEMTRKSFFATLFAPFGASAALRESVQYGFITGTEIAAARRHQQEAFDRAIGSMRKPGDGWASTTISPGDTFDGPGGKLYRVQMPPRFKYGGGAGCGGHVSKEEQAC